MHQPEFHPVPTHPWLRLRRTLDNLFARQTDADSTNGAATLNRKLLVLGALGLLLVALFLTIDVNGHWDFALPRRARKVAAIAIVGFAIAYATVLFQTLTNNRILTPSIIGFDSLYMLIQTLIVFSLGGMFRATLDDRIIFPITAGLMILCAGLLFRWLFLREGRNLYLLVLVGVIFGTLFRSATSFLQRVMDPNEFSILQSLMFASFNQVNQELMLIAGLAVAGITLYSLRFGPVLDVLSLGRDHAVNLGVDHAHAVNRLMMVIAVLVSISTALVGPITFFGLLVANLAYQYMQTYRHAYLVPAAVLLSIVALVGGQLLVERVFTFSTSLSVIVNFIGGVYFLYLLLKESQA